MNRINVMHLTDTLDAGGRERVAVDLANVLPRERYQVHLCTTRHDGLLADLVAKDVGRLRLRRQHRFDVRAVQHLNAYIREHRIRILHAHETSLFIAAAVSRFPPYPVVIWHDHFGRYEMEERPAWLYRLATKGIGGVIAVNEPLAEWSRRRLRVPADQVWFIPNFVCEPSGNKELLDMPGTAGSRIVCVANFRSQKDHLTLLRAMKIVTQQIPAAHLLLVGAESETAYLKLVREEVARQELNGHVTLLGQRQDVSAILRASDIGVLSSASEGLPLALLEYGMARLPAVATQVGQCAEVLDQGRVGILVSPGAPDKLAEALLSLLRSPERRAHLGEQFRRRVQQVYSPDSVIRQICRVYDHVIGAEQRELPETIHTKQQSF